MHDNIVQFAPAAKAERAAFSRVQGEASSASSVVQFRPASRSVPAWHGVLLSGGELRDAIEALPKEEKQLVAHEIMSRISEKQHTAGLPGRVSTDISLNERLRDERRRKWDRASARAELSRAMMDMHFKISIAQQYRLPEVEGHPPSDSHEYARLVLEWRQAAMQLLLTPAPDLKSLVWKRRRVERLNQCDWLDVKPRRMERMLADDEAFLKAYPTRHCRHRAN